MPSRKKTYKVIYKALEETGLPWTEKTGSKHHKLYLDGHLIGILPHGKNTANEASMRMNKNIVARIRRAAESLKAGEQP